MNLTPFVTPAEEMKGEREERLANAERVIKFGVPFLDDALLGIAKNDLVLIAARSGNGKSELATHISLVNAMEGKTVYHLALEAERREITRRMLYKRMSKRFYEQVVRTGGKPNYLHWYMGKQEAMLGHLHESAAEDLENYSSLKIYYRGTDFGMKELSDIFASIKGKADLLTLDHLHYVDFADENENRAHKQAVKEIRDLALLHSIPVILVAHIRKTDRRFAMPVPDLEDIHGSSDIFKIATKAIMIAPAKDQDVLPGTSTYRFPTYMRIVKCRQDGSLPWFTGLTAFDISTGEYDAKYELGSHDGEGRWKRSPEKPFWAVRAI